MPSIVVILVKLSNVTVPPEPYVVTPVIWLGDVGSISTVHISVPVVSAQTTSGCPLSRLVSPAKKLVLLTVLLSPAACSVAVELPNAVRLMLDNLILLSAVDGRQVAVTSSAAIGINKPT